MAGRPKARWSRELTSVWILTRSLNLISSILREQADARKHGRRSPGTISFALVALASSKNYPRGGGAAPAADWFRHEYSKAATELEHSGLLPNRDDDFERDAVLTTWPPIRRPHGGGYYPRHTSGWTSIVEYIQLILTERPTEWNGIKGWLEPDDRDTAAHGEKGGTPSQRRTLADAIVFAFRENRAMFRMGLIDQQTYKQRLANIWRWRKSRSGGGSLRAE